MELTELLKEKEKILVGIGREWKNRTEGCAALLKLLEGKDADKSSAAARAESRRSGRNTKTPRGSRTGKSNR